MEKLYFIEKIDQKYGAEAGNIFLLHGNIHDIFPARNGIWKPLLPLLADEFSKKNRIFIQIDLAGGFSVLPVWPSSIEDLGDEEKKKLECQSNAEQEESLKKLRDEHRITQIDYLRRLLGNTPLSESEQYGRKNRQAGNLYDFLEQESIQSSFAALTLAGEIIERLRQSPSLEKHRIIFFLNGADSIVPAQNESNLGEHDRRNIQTIETWFNETAFLASQNVVIMTSHSLEGVNAKIRSLPQLTPLKIQRPDKNSRYALIKYFLGKNEKSLRLADGFTLDDLAAATAGLTSRDIDQMLRTVKFSAAEKQGIADISLDSIKTRSREVLEQSAGGYIEFIELTHGLDAVIGQDRLVSRLKSLAAIFRQGKNSAIPPGILVPGPNGGGKSFVFTGFAKETGWHAIKLKNIRNMYYGETERIWEMIEEITEAIGRINIIVDEGDTELGGRGQNVHEVDKRLFGKILKMMEDKKNKGRICWIIITARPDKLEPDIKRSGRAGRHYPVFAPETEKEKMDFIEIIFSRRFGLSWEKINSKEKEKIFTLINNFYPADFDLLLEQVEEMKVAADKENISWQDIINEAQVLKPSDPILERKLQVYLALLECTDERLVPDMHKNLFGDREDLVKKIIELKKTLSTN